MPSRPQPQSDAVRQRFERQKRRDTKPELLLRRELHRRGLRYRVDRAILSDRRRRVDIVFGPAKVAIFVDGCFWHRCPDHGNLPKANREWWKAKLHANVARDRDTDARLAEAGWVVLRFWEHELRADAERVATHVEAVLTDRRPLA